MLVIGSPHCSNNTLSIQITNFCLGFQRAPFHANKSFGFPWQSQTESLPRKLSPPPCLQMAILHIEQARKGRKTHSSETKMQGFFLFLITSLSNFSKRHVTLLLLTCFLFLAAIDSQHPSLSLQSDCKKLTLKHYLQNRSDRCTMGAAAGHANVV